MSPLAKPPTVRRPRRGGTTMMAASAGVPGAEKAYHHMTGRVERRFFDVNDEDLDVIVEKVATDAIARAKATEQGA
jgi:hypothetical protein